MIRLALFVSAMAVVQALFFAALSPLLPAFTDELGLSKAQAGLLVGMFPVGQGVAAVPVGVLASRVGVKRFALSGLALLAATSIGFGIADDFGELLATRFLQGVGAALCWSSGLAWLVAAAPRGRRGEMIGIFTGAGAAGQVLGPAVGGLAVVTSRMEVFGAMAALAAILALVGSRFSGPAHGRRQSLALIKQAHRSRDVVGGLWLVVVPGLLIGTIFVLGPLQLNRLGSGPIGIAGAFLGASAVGVLGRPVIGRWADRNGQLRAIQLLLLVSIPLTLVVPWVGDRWLLSGCVVLAVSTYGFFWGPSMALVSHAYDEAEIAHVLGFALIGLTIGAGFFVGSTVGGEIAHFAGDKAAYAVPVALCLATAATIALQAGRRTTPPAEEPVPGRLG